MQHTDTNQLFTIIHRPSLGKRSDTSDIPHSLSNTLLLRRAEAFDRKAIQKIETLYRPTIINIPSITPHIPNTYNIQNHIMQDILKSYGPMTLLWEYIAPYFCTFVLSDDFEHFSYGRFAALDGPAQNLILKYLEKNIRRARSQLRLIQKITGGQMHHTITFGYVDPTSYDVLHLGLEAGQQTNENMHINSFLMPEISTYPMGEHLDGSLVRLEEKDFFLQCSTFEKHKMHDTLTRKILHMGGRKILKKHIANIFIGENIDDIFMEYPSTYFDGWEVQCIRPLPFTSFYQKCIRLSALLHQEWAIYKSAYEKGVKEKTLPILERELIAERSIIEILKKFLPTKQMKGYWNIKEMNVAKEHLHISAKPSFTVLCSDMEEKDDILYVKSFKIAPSFSKQKGGVECFFRSILRD